MATQLLQGLLFYFVFSLFGILALPILLRFKTKGTLLYLFAKPIGLLLFAYPIWLLASVRILKFNNPYVLPFLFFVAISVAGYFVFTFLKDAKNIQVRKRLLSKSFLLKFLAYELISILLLLGYLYIRGFSGALESTEKPMDLLLLMSAGKTDFFPFKDPWQATQVVNYYYYGFYLFALITRLTFIPYAIAYNISLGLIFLQTVILSFAIVYRLTKSKLFALLGMAMVTFAGNIHYTSCLIKNYGKGDLTNVCYYPKATRIYDPAFTINEMPSYSFILGDMHPHVMSIPFFLTNLYLLTLIFKKHKVNYWLYSIFTLTLGTSFMINTWDFVVLGFIFALIFIYKIFSRIKRWKQTNAKNLPPFNSIVEFVKKYRIFIGFALLFTISPLLYLPFLLHFKSPVEGVGFAPTYVKSVQQAGQDFQYPSSLWFQFGLWGGYFICTTLGILFLVFRNEKIKKLIFPLFLFATAIVFINFIELFYFRDLFHAANPQYFRANTVFKFGYLAWILMGIAFAIISSYVWQNLRNVKGIKLGMFLDFLFVMLVQLYAIAMLIYPFIAVKQAYSPSFPWSERAKVWTLNGSNYVKSREPDDYATITWINQNFTERRNIVEAVGGSYTYYARISVHTGMVNPINWPTHEWTWRFHYPEGVKSWRDVVGKNLDTGYSAISVIEQDVKKIYETSDVNERKSLINKYGIEFIYIGNLERTTYPGLQEQLIVEGGTVVFVSGNSKLIKV